MIRTWFSRAKDEKLHEVKDFKSGSWIDVEDATKAELKKIAELTNLKYEDLQDVLDKFEIPRIERQTGAIILVLRNPLLEEMENSYTEALTIVVTNKFFVTISSSKNTLVKLAKKQHQDISTTQRGKMLINFFYLVANQYTKYIQVVANKVFKSKREFEDVKNKEILRITKNQDILNQYLSALVPMQTVFESVMSGSQIALYDNDKELLYDAYVAVNQSVATARVNLKSMTNLVDAYQIIFTNTLNKNIQFLTSITIVLTVPTVVSSIYGMNVQLPFMNSPVAFWVVMIFALSISCGLYIVFRVRGWL